MHYFYPEEAFAWLFALVPGIPYGLFGIAAYVLTALSLYTIAQRRGIRKAWLAWVPVVNCWVLGSLSDQYRYVVHGQIKYKRKLLLILNILKTALQTTILVMVGVFVGTLFADRTGAVMGSLFSLLGLLLPWAAVVIASCVLSYMALYDLFNSLDPDNSILFLVLSILFPPTKPFFLFFSRQKDQGMPPRVQP